MADAELTDEQLDRFARHVNMLEIGPEGQKKLLDAKILIVGLGGLGSPVALYLTAAGIGKLGLLDHDSVELTNLQRQIVHDTPSIGRPKVESAAEKLNALHPGTETVLHSDGLRTTNALELVAQYDIVMDCTDNFTARYVMNDATQIAGRPMVHGSIYQFDGRASVFMPGKGTPCYRCILPEPPPVEVTKAQGGPFGVLPGVIGAIQATEAIKLVLGLGTPLVGQLLGFDALEMEFFKLRTKWDPNCAVCGENPTITEIGSDYHFEEPAPLKVGPE